MSNFRLQELREAASLTKVELARRAGVSERTIRNIENGSEPTWETARAIARALGVPLQTLAEKP